MFDENFINTSFILPSLSTLTMNVEKTFSRLLNTIKNKLLFELDEPGYNFLGPGYKLNQGIARGGLAINPLGEAAKENDIWCRVHQKTEDKWIADKVSQQEAWYRVIYKNADIGERAFALATAGGMWLK